jgi:RHS repeat-associated protein
LSAKYLDGASQSSTQGQGEISYNTEPFKYRRERGCTYYELSNHLGNVLVTVTDMKIGIENDFWTAEYYEATVVSANDYYPFGSAMAGRKYNQGTYRYGFNGKEEDKEWGSQMIQDYGFRIYNPTIGKFLSVDPLSSSYPWYTPYQFAGNKPIVAIDLDGLEEFEVVGLNGQQGYIIGAGPITLETAQKIALEHPERIAYVLPTVPVQAPTSAPSDIQIRPAPRAGTQPKPNGGNWFRGLITWGSRVSVGIGCVTMFQSDNKVPTFSESDFIRLEAEAQLILERDGKLDDETIKKIEAYITDFESNAHSEVMNKERKKGFIAYIAVRNHKENDPSLSVDQPLTYSGSTGKKIFAERYTKTSDALQRATGEVIASKVDRATARGIEQVIAELNVTDGKTMSQSGTVDNKQNPINAVRKVFMYRKLKAYLWLEANKPIWRNEYLRDKTKAKQKAADAGF